MRTLLNRFVCDEQGQDLIEYALLGALISVASIVAINALGGAIRVRFSTIGSSVTAAS